MSYQFEDDSALEELLNQQLDRRKQQQNSTASKQARNASRPATGGVSQPAWPTSQFRPSTAASSGAVQRTKPSEVSEDQFAPASLPSAGRTPLSSWLQGASKQEKVVSSGRAPTAMKPAGELRPKLSVANERVAAFGDQDEKDAANSTNNSNYNNTLLGDLLAPANLQDMSKQRLIQVIMEEVKPRLSQLESSQGSQGERERLERALQFEQNQLANMEMRHAERLEFERQKWLQINQQLESRLQSGDEQMAKLLEDQRNHLAQLNESYQKQLESMGANLNERLRFERTRFDEMLRERDEMHKLELEAKMGVAISLDKLNAVQLDWRRMLEATIEKLGHQYKAVEAQLERQALLVNGSNSELTNRTKLLCDQYDNYNENQIELKRVVGELGGLISGLAQLELRAGGSLELVDDKLAKLGGQLAALAENEKQVASSRIELEELRKTAQEEKFKLALDASRVSMKEERLDELLARNSKLEFELAGERKSLMESQMQLNSRRLALDERFAELKEQNYALHLLRKRLVNEREELVGAQLELAEERKTFKSNRSQVEDESRRLETLKVRVQRELDQLARLQKSLVCSLCLSRLFGNDQTDQDDAGQRLGSGRLSLTGNIFAGTKLDRLQAVSRTRAGGPQRMPRVGQVKDKEEDNDDELAKQMRRTQLNAAEIEAENKRIEELIGTELL